MINIYKILNKLLKEEASIGFDPQSGSTQISSTINTYKKVPQILSKYGDIKTMKVLDYGAGLGLGADILRSQIPNIDTYEVNPQRWRGVIQPTYTKSNDIQNKYDAIINLNVLNVVPKNIRDQIVKKYC